MWLFIVILARYKKEKKLKIDVINISLAGDHLYRKWLFTSLSLVMFLMVSYFVLYFFSRDVFDEILD